MLVVAPFRVVLDANVLFPFTLRDTLLRAAEKGLYQLVLTDRILDEAVKNLVKRGEMDEGKATRLRAMIVEAFPEALVDDYNALIPSMRNDEKDRHVAAAAVKAGAQVIVTFNLKDFRDLQEGLEALHPDRFLVDLHDLAPVTVLGLVRDQAASLKRPSRTLAELLEALAHLVPEFAEALKRQQARVTSSQ